jgi:glycosyltransferase involved in cell wall biosynthesis
MSDVPLPGKTPMRILALEPYYGGSHKAFLDAWRGRSRHDWTLLTLPARKWKWRMRHAAVTFADRLTAGWDVLFCSDMLNLAELRGLAPPAVRSLPAVAYFHENQFTYPFRHASERDYHYGFINMTTALAADAVWFNSAYHRDAFLAALNDVLRRMPDHAPMHAVDRIAANAAVEPPGVEVFCPRGARVPGPMRILWAARWEHDKNPETFFEALRRLRGGGVAFRLSVIGEQFRDRPAVFDITREDFSDSIDRWGYQPSHEDYAAALLEADVFVSTADHEFFGLAVAEAIAAGAYPLLPRRLAYPELVSRIDSNDPGRFLYDGDAETLAGRLAELAARVASGTLWEGDATRGIAAMRSLNWARRAAELDDAVESVVSG